MTELQQVQDAYKLGFIHGAIAMLQYIKYRIMPTMRQKTLPNKGHLDITFLSKLREASKKAIKMMAVESYQGDYVLITKDVTMFIGFDVYTISPNPYHRRYIFGPIEDAIERLNSARRETIMDFIRKEKKSRRIIARNKYLEKL